MCHHNTGVELHQLSELRLNQDPSLPNVSKYVYIAPVCKFTPKDTLTAELLNQRESTLRFYLGTLCITCAGADKEVYI